MDISVKRVADSWEISDRRVHDLCSQGKVEGAVREGRSWKIPQDTPKPVDGRYKKAESLMDLIDQKMTKLASLHPLTQGEVERLDEEFMEAGTKV